MKFLLMAAFTGILLFLSGCAMFQPVTDPTRLYILSVDEKGEEDGEELTLEETEDAIAVGLHRVQIPVYLNTPSIAMLTRDNTIRYGVYDRWAENLDRGLGRIIRGNLRQYGLFEIVDIFPGRSGERYDVEIVLVVEACDAILPETESGEGSYSFHVSWEVMGNEGRTRLSQGDFIDEGPWQPMDFSGFARLISDASRNLSRELVAEIARLRVTIE